jgi:recombination protein RecT
MENKKNEVVNVEKNITTTVQNRVQELAKAGRIDLPKDYSIGNAMNSAWLILQNVKDKNYKKALEVCTKDSIANALLDMAVLGLNPAKQQGYFIVYGNQLSWFTSYFGNIAAIQRIKGYEDLPSATLIYEGDEVELTHDELGEEIIKSHETTWENKLKGNIVGAYASIKFGGRMRQQVMTMADIKESWSMSKTNKEHKQFTGEFAKRTVLNRLMKNILKTSTDDDLVAETMIKTENEHYEFDNDQVIDQVTEEVENETAKQDLPLPTHEEETQKAGDPPKKENFDVDNDGNPF